MSERSGRAIGRSLPRREDLRFLRGEGTFVADMCEPGDLHLAVVRSPVAHGTITAVDSSAARSAPGVFGVFTGADLPEAGTVAPLTTPHPEFIASYDFWMAPVHLRCLAQGRVRYVGEPIAVVVAESRACAEDAAELVVVEIDELDPVMTATDPGPDLHPEAPGNVGARLSYETGTPPDGSIEMTAVDLDLAVDRHAGVPLETRGVRAVPSAGQVDGGGGVRVVTSTQVPHLVRQAISTATGWPSSDIVVEVPDVGGGFGTKANVYPEEIIVPVVARRLGRPVVFIEDRSEHLLAAAQGRDQRHHVRLTTDKEGHILSLEVDIDVDLGAGSLWTAGIIANSAIHLLGPYHLPHARVRGLARFSNKAPSAQYRGAGRPEACFTLERALDAAAAELGLGRVEIRRRNLPGSDDLPMRLDLPYRDGVPITFDGGDWRRCLDAVVEALPPSAVDDIELSEHERAGWGVACYVEATGRGPFEAARVRVTTDGFIEVITGGASAGQGHETVFAQVAADAAGVDVERVRVLRTDTATVPNGIGTFASRTAVLAGNAVSAAARELGELLRKWVGADPDGPITIDESGVHSTAHAKRWADLDDEWTLDDFDVQSRFETETVTWTMGAHAAVVAVDAATGSTRVARYAVVHEGGLELNPKIVLGQVRGGVAQGIGGALLEASRYAPDGQPIAVSLADYLLPTASDVPPITVEHHEVATYANPLGVRGVGESGTIAGYAVIAGAVDDACPGGTFVRQTPITPERLRAIVATQREPRQ